LTTTAAPTEWIDSSHATRRLLITLALMTLGNASMYVMAVVLPAVQAEFGVWRARSQSIRWERRWWSKFVLWQIMLTSFDSFQGRLARQAV